MRSVVHERLAKTRRLHDLQSARLLISRGASYDLPTAAALGDIDRVTAILDDNPARISETRPNGRRPLSAAVEFGHERIVRLLLERGTDPTWPDADDSPRGSAVHAAARAQSHFRRLLLAHCISDGNSTLRQRDVCSADAGRRALLFAYCAVILYSSGSATMNIYRARRSCVCHAAAWRLHSVCTRGNRSRCAARAGVTVPPFAADANLSLERPYMLRLLLAAAD